ncbi:beta-lactamase-like protein [Polychytrium aggregatum]|uniref:beta-lactamase-like protein n=1 Tax=Polychytrium aggregatum TaxID=110093 RepID=UPI0022FEAAB4|nr:beta-lactamase-like protein [Polychytrium aggregatum]KAI9202724.1 beta-lactamase-like protein [Polychytrium aggregatum]
MKSFIQILGTETGDSTPSVLACFDTQKYLFNVGEGTQRFCIENKVRLSKLQHIFLTKIRWSSCGGIPGMLLSLADAGNRRITLHGGKNLTHFLASTRHFVFRMDSAVSTNEMDDYSPNFKDENLDIQRVAIYPSDSDNPNLTPINVVAGKRKAATLDSEEDVQSLTPEEALAHKRYIISRMFLNGESLSIPVNREEGKDSSKGAALGSSGVGVVPIPPTKPDLGVLTYICQGPSVKGKFSPEKAQALGAKPGKEYGMLYNGETLTLSDGRKIAPHQVMGPEQPGSIFIIVDCPSTEYVQPLIHNEAFAPHYDGVSRNYVRVIVHMLGPNALNASYKEWMKRFGQHTQHIVISPQYCAKPIVFQGSALSQYRLNVLDPSIFTLPFYTNVPAPLDSDVPEKTIVGAHMLIYDLEPQPKLNANEQRAVLDPNDPEGRVTLGWKKLSAYRQEAERVRAAILEAADANESPASQKHGGADVQVTTLGTGAALPSRYRNVSSTLIWIPGYGAILLDAGEGTYGQLYRRFQSPDNNGPQLDELLVNLKLVFISHMHADHHLGAIHILRKRKELFESRGTPLQPLTIIGPPQYRMWLDEYNGCEDIGMDPSTICFIPCDSCLLNEPEAASATKTAIVKSNLNFKDLSTIKVEHCHYAYALIMESMDGWKIVYSGDCRPNLELMKAGADADLLIHEATFENDLLHEAKDKRHCTTGEAIIVAQRMRARTVLLTHFSQRYPQLPVYEDPTKTVGVAFDLMSVRLKELWRLPLFLKSLELLYPCNARGVDLDDDDDECAFGAAGGFKEKDKGGSGRRGGRDSRGGSRRGGSQRGGRGGGRGGGGGGGGRGRGRGGDRGGKFGRGGGGGGRGNRGGGRGDRGAGKGENSK